MIPHIYSSESIVFLKDFNINEWYKYSVPERIKYARLSSGKTSKFLAADIGMELSTYSRYEIGKITADNMNVDILKKVALACSFDEYFCCDGYQRFKENSDVYVKDYMADNKLTNEKAWKSKKIQPLIETMGGCI